MKTTNNNLRYIAYIRKSEVREDKQVLSHPAQKRKVEEQFPELNIIDFRFESESAFKPGRPVFNKLMEDILNGEAEGIVGWHPNRCSRNEIDSATMTYALRGPLKDLKFCSFNFDNSPEGIMMLQMTMNHAQYESSKQGQDVKRGMEEKANGGERPGQVPQGYIKVPVLDEKGRAIIRKDKVITKTEDDSERWQLIDKMWDMLLYEGFNPDQIWKKATFEWGYLTRKTTKKTGGKLMPKSMIYSIFTNPFYAGKIPHNGEYYDGNHHAMITWEEFKTAQLLLGKRGNPRVGAFEYAYTGLIKCGVCGCSIIAKHRIKYIKSTQQNFNYIHYYCTRKSLSRPCNQREYTRVEVIEAEIDQELSKYTIIPEFRDLAIKILRRKHKIEVKDRQSIYGMQQKQHNEIQTKLDKLVDMRTSGLIDDNEYKHQKERLKQEIAEVKESLNDTDKRAEDWLELTEKAFEFATYARIKFQNGDIKTKRDILTTLGQNLILKDNKLQITPNEWLIPISEAYPKLEKEYLKGRTKKNTSSKELNEASELIFERWRARRDLNPRHPA
jgi:site-specific DNA recombinase